MQYEDKLSQAQRIRLESIGQAIHFHHVNNAIGQSVTGDTIVDTATKFQTFIEVENTDDRPSEGDYSGEDKLRRKHRKKHR